MGCLGPWPISWWGPISLPTNQEANCLLAELWPGRQKSPIFSCRVLLLSSLRWACEPWGILLEGVCRRRAALRGCSGHWTRPQTQPLLGTVTPPSPHRLPACLCSGHSVRKFLETRRNVPYSYHISCQMCLGIRTKQKSFWQDWNMKQGDHEELRIKFVSIENSEIAKWHHCQMGGWRDSTPTEAGVGDLYTSGCWIKDSTDTIPGPLTVTHKHSESGMHNRTLGPWNPTRIFGWRTGKQGPCESHYVRGEETYSRPAVNTGLSGRANPGSQCHEASSGSQGRHLHSGPLVPDPGLIPLSLIHSQIKQESSQD